MTINLIYLIGGLLLVLFGANWLVDGASNVAKKFGMSEFIIGLTIVGIGTSAPEMVVSWLSSFEGKASMAIGNVIGSNIFNTALILGITALIMPMTITASNRKKDIPLNIIVTLLLIILGMNKTLFGLGESDQLSRVEGLVFLLIFIAYLAYSFKHDDGEGGEEIAQLTGWKATMGGSIFMIVAGLAGLIFGGDKFVEGATYLAQHFGVSDKFIAITVLAGGTSLPELATCIVAACKGRGQLALGNILGSNISNILLILGGAALINPIGFGDLTVVDLATVLLCAVFILLSALVIKKNKLTRFEGALLVAIEVAYMWYLITNL